MCGLGYMWMAIPISISSVFPATTATSTATGVDPRLEHVLPNGVTIYGRDEEAFHALSQVTLEFEDVFMDTGSTIDIPEEQWMPIPLKADAKAKPSKMYPLGQRVVGDVCPHLSAAMRRPMIQGNCLDATFTMNDSNEIRKVSIIHRTRDQSPFIFELGGHEKGSPPMILIEKNSNRGRSISISH